MDLHQLFIFLFRNIRVMVKNLPVDQKERREKEIRPLINKLDKCRNEENNPDSAAYKRKLELVDEEDLMIVEEIPSKQARMDGVRALSPGGG